MERFSNELVTNGYKAIAEYNVMWLDFANVNGVTYQALGNADKGDVAYFSGPDTILHIKAAEHDLGEIHFCMHGDSNK